MNVHVQRRHVLLLTDQRRVRPSAQPSSSPRPRAEEQERIGSCGDTHTHARISESERLPIIPSDHVQSRTCYRFAVFGHVIQLKPVVTVTPEAARQVYTDLSASVCVCTLVHVYTHTHTPHTLHLAFSRRFYLKSLTVHSGYTFFQYVFPEN